MPATAGLYTDLTVQENLDFSAGAYRLSGREYRQKSGELLERTGLGRARDRLGGQLSGGHAAQAGRRDWPSCTRPSCWSSTSRPPGSTR